MAAQREAVRLATAGMSSAERREFQADHLRERMANHPGVALATLVAASLLVLGTGTYQLVTAGAVHRVSALVRATGWLLQAGYLAYFWIRYSESRRLRQ